MAKQPGNLLTVLDVGIPVEDILDISDIGQNHLQPLLQSGYNHQNLTTFFLPQKGYDGRGYSSIIFILRGALVGHDDLDKSDVTIKGGNLWQTRFQEGRGL